MSRRSRILIVDGYPKASRDELEAAGMKTAWKLYDGMIRRHLRGAQTRVWLPSDTADLPDGEGPGTYDGILWTGCNLTIYHHHDDRVTRQIEFARRAYAAGTPQFGTCWGIQMATVAAGGEVAANPKGREMGLARRIRLTPEGARHPFLRGRTPVFTGFISHLDMVTRLPRGATWLATNDFSRVQAAAIRHGRGVFWATQYHPEYDLHDMARLIVAREGKLVKEGFYRNHRELAAHVGLMEALARNPDRKDLRWQLDIGDDILVTESRQLEVANWVSECVLRRRR
ncbi:MAG: type 1 glutamine amidotransferase [Candidatus Coatesbacteria bacterium]